jgi:hypothetical protein
MQHADDVLGELCTSDPERIKVSASTTEASTGMTSAMHSTTI